MMEYIFPRQKMARNQIGIVMQNRLVQKFLNHQSKGWVGGKSGA